MNNTITFDYEIESLGIYDSIHGKSNVVYEVRGLFVGKKTITTESGSGTTTKSLILVVNLPIKLENNSNSFIEYENLTKQDIVRWIEENTNQKTIDNHKINLIEQLSPTKRYVKPNF